MVHKIISVKTKDNLIVVATFFDGAVKEYDIKNLFGLYPQLKQLESDEKMFKAAQVDAGGYGISWNDDLDLDSDTIWEEGVEVGNEQTNPILELAAKLAEARDKVGLTQKQLAEKTGIYQADISKIERGLANPSVGTLQRLADGMGVKLQIGFR